MENCRKHNVEVNLVFSINQKMIQVDNLPVASWSSKQIQQLQLKDVYFIRSSGERGGGGGEESAGGRREQTTGQHRVSCPLGCLLAGWLDHSSLLLHSFISPFLSRPPPPPPITPSPQAVWLQSTFTTDYHTVWLTGKENFTWRLELLVQTSNTGWILEFSWFLICLYVFSCVDKNLLWIVNCDIWMIWVFPVSKSGKTDKINYNCFYVPCLTCKALNVIEAPFYFLQFVC